MPRRRPVALLPILVIACLLVTNRRLDAQVIIRDCLIMPKAQCPNAWFVNLDMKGYKLSDSDLSGAQFDGSDLTSADLSGANLSNGSFLHTTLSLADLSNADLNGASLGDSTIESAKTSTTPAFRRRSWALARRPSWTAAT